MQTSVMFSPCSKTQSLGILFPVAAQVVCPSVLHRSVSSFNPTANLHPTFLQLASVIAKSPLSNLFLLLPFSPCSKLTHLAYISLTACYSCPHPVLLLSNDCSILVRSSIPPQHISLIVLAVPLVLHAECTAL